MKRLAVLLAPTLAACAPHPAVEESAALRAILEPIVREEGVPALSAAIAHREGPVEAAAVGVRVLGLPAPVTISDRFHVGSVTKPILATAIATLVEDGTLAWDRRVEDALPECAETMREEYRGVTLADLLAHEAGLPAFDDEKDFEGIDLSGDPVDARRRFACDVLSREPAVPPGTAFHYSNAGYAVAAAIAERATGKTWDDLVARRVFEPLVIRDWGIGWPASGGRAEPWGHWRKEGELVPHDPDGDYRLSSAIAPAGDLNLSMPDLALFLRTHLRALHGDRALLRPETARRMHTRRIRSGLGWGVQKLGDLDPVSVFQGSAETFVTVVAVAPGADLAVAVSASSGDEAGDRAAKRALKAILAARERR